jgi:DNA repair protein RadC
MKIHTEKQMMPREKLRDRGAESLTDLELLQIVIGSGGVGNDFRQIAKELYKKINQVGKSQIAYEDITGIKGIGAAKGSIVFAALEFWRRQFQKPSSPVLATSESVVEQLADIRNKKQEYFMLLTLDGARRLINKHTISIGTVNASIVHPREIFAAAIEDRAATIIIAHNHPSGTLDISMQDREVTERIKESGKLLGIPLDNHIVVTADDFISVME